MDRRPTGPGWPVCADAPPADG